MVPNCVNWVCELFKGLRFETRKYFFPGLKYKKNTAGLKVKGVQVVIEISLLRSCDIMITFDRFDMMWEQGLQSSYNGCGVAIYLGNCLYDSTVWCHFPLIV